MFTSSTMLKNCMIQYRHIKSNLKRCRMSQSSCKEKYFTFISLSKIYIHILCKLSYCVKFNSFLVHYLVTWVTDDHRHVSTGWRSLSTSDFSITLLTCTRFSDDFRNIVRRIRRRSAGSVAALLACTKYRH